MPSAAGKLIGGRGHRPPEATFLGVMRVREFRGLWFSQLTSLIGDQFSKLALAVLVYGESKNALLASLVYAVGYLPALVAGPPSGLLIDIKPRRQVMLMCDLGRAVLIGSMCIPGMPLVGFFALLLASTALESPFGTARTALLPDILKGEAYTAGQSLTSVTDSLGQVIGFAVGGLLLGFVSVRTALAIDASTFVLSALFLLAYVKARPAAAVRSEESYWHNNAQGARVIKRSRLLRNLIGIMCIGLGLIIATEGLAVSYAAQLGVGKLATGFLSAALPTGLAIGALIVGRWVAPNHRMIAIRLMALTWPIPLVLTILKPPVAVSFVLWVVAGALMAYVLLASILFTLAVEPAMLGRAYAVARGAFVAAQGIGLVVTGALAYLLDPATAVALSGVAGLVLCPLFVIALKPAGRHRVEGLTYSDATPGSRELGVRTAPDDLAAGLMAAPASRGHLSAEPEVSEPTGRIPRSSPWPLRLMHLASFTIFAGAVLFAIFQVVPDGRIDPPTHLPWWVLAISFALIDTFCIPFQRGEHSTIASLNQIAVVLALFFSSPTELLIGVVVGVTISDLRTWRGFTPFITGRTADVLLATISSVLFAELRPESGFGWAALGAAMLATIVGDMTAFCFVALGRLAYDRSASYRDFIAPLRFAVVTVTAATSLGLLAVAAMWANTSYGWLVVGGGALLIAGSRAFADLQVRHLDLGALYSFKEKLGPLLPDASQLWPVLQSAREILNATTVELSLTPEADPTTIRQGLSRMLIAEADSSTRTRWRSAAEIVRESEASALPESMTVVLGEPGRVLGRLTARHRQGHLRGFRPTDLRLLETLAVQVSDALERGQLIAELQDAATHDALTGLLTLSEFSNQVDDRLIRGDGVLLALLDVARLKDVNDSLGHEAGDALLRTVADRLGEFVPPSTLLGRSGGGEFAIAIPHIHQFHAAEAVDRVAEGLTGLVQVLGVTVDLRTRVGWVLAPVDGLDAANLLRRADLALGAAKRGSQRSMRFAPEYEVDGRRRLRLVNDLRDAIENGEIQVVYQPLVTPADNKVVGAEALSRWDHHELGPMRPDEFIVIAEQSGLISALTEHVLDVALAQTRAWHDEGRADLRIAVNLSARCLSDLGLPSMVLDMLARHRVQPHQLTLEVTETSVAEDPERARVVLERLRGLGVRLSLDDFGTGYSSLASLKRFPVHEVKLDRQFLVDLEAGLSSPDDEDFSAPDAHVDIALLTAVVALGHSLDLEIIAEGIETRAAYMRLRALGVDILQGYYLGRPGPGDDLPVRFTLDDAEDPRFENEARVP
jgi:diguanylate cyclase (GGDEF)-like protein